MTDQEKLAEAYNTEFSRRFAEREEKQLNSGRCAAIIVDCDCYWCIRNDVEYEMRHCKPDTLKGEEFENGYMS